ncbi:MAG: gentisate 1,2-dioxygenase [Stellaceae bacterium]
MTTEVREAYYARVGKLALSPLWTTRLVPPEPKDHVKAEPYLWDYDNVVRPILMESGPLITAKEANRRVLTLENPGLGGSHRVLESLFAGLQLILPGEVAPAHRHSPSALRFIMEGEGAYTAVSGEKSYMHRGDFIITPSMTWHDHGHEGSAPVVWMDGLDIPMVGTFGPMFFDNYGGDRHPERRLPGDSRARYGANMRPLNESWAKPESPIFHYPYERSRQALEDLRRGSAWDPAAALKLEYIDPTRGGSAMPTISTFLQLLPKGFSGATYRSTENAVYSPIEGKGRAIVGDGEEARAIAWKARDIFAIPCWVPHRLEADADAILFSFSDRVAQQKLGFWREERPIN